MRIVRERAPPVRKSSKSPRISRSATGLISRRISRGTSGTLPNTFGTCPSTTCSIALHRLADTAADDNPSRVSAGFFLRAVVLQPAGVDADFEVRDLAGRSLDVPFDVAGHGVV